MQPRKKNAKPNKFKKFYKTIYYQKIWPQLISVKNMLKEILISAKNLLPKRKSKPRKVLITSIGRFIEKLSFTTVGISIILIVFLSAAFAHYYGVSYNDKPFKPDWSDAIYFSVITFTSLGYGDIVPTGLGKSVAIAEVLLGLALVAIFIGKIASERQSALVLLLYTSEQQQRLVKFVTDLSTVQNELSGKLEQKNDKDIRECALSAYHFTSSICAYLTVQANQGDIAAFGNISSLRKLYQTFEQIQITAFKGLHQYGLASTTTRVLGNVIGILSGNAKRMIFFHKKDLSGQALLRKIIANGEKLAKYNKDLESGDLVIYSQTRLTDELLSSVKSFVSGKPKARNFHKEIAMEFGIPNGLADKCLKIIGNEGQIEKPRTS